MKADRGAATMAHELPTNKPIVLKKFGEVSNQPLYQVRGDAHWFSSPEVALAQHRKMKIFTDNGGWKKAK